MWVLIVLLLAAPVLACPKDTTEYKGACYAEIEPQKDTTPSVVPSDEKPPKDKMPSYQREGVHADMPPVSKEDEDKNKASWEGKKAAGLK